MTSGTVIRCPKLAKLTLANDITNVQKSSHIILLLEDDENDVFLMQRAFKHNGITNRLFILPDGQEGIDYMEGVGPYKDRTQYPSPDVIILDLKMPRKSGLEFLEWMKAHPDLRVIPMILLTSSTEDPDVSRAYDLGANTYFMKPGSYSELVELVKTMQDYWSKAVKPKSKYKGLMVSSRKTASGS
jgi:CheY-like chemotaxis protein